MSHFGLLDRLGSGLGLKPVKLPIARTKQRDCVDGAVPSSLDGTIAYGRPVPSPARLWYRLDGTVASALSKSLYARHTSYAVRGKIQIFGIKLWALGGLNQKSKKTLL